MKKTVIQIILSVIILTFIILGIICFMNNNTTKNEIDSEYEELKKNSIMYDENASIEELKQEYKMTGDTELYEIQTEYDGRKVLAIKADENYKVAFVGLIKKSKPDLNKSTEIFEQNHPNKKGIWIEAESRERILNYLNNTLKSTYMIDEDGYLNISNLQESKNDDIINSLINGEKQYILSINSTTYYIDALTGEVIDNPYEEFDEAQTYSYFEDGNKMIIFIPENKDKHLSNEEIFESIIELVK